MPEDFRTWTSTTKVRLGNELKKTGGKWGTRHEHKIYGCQENPFGTPTLPYHWKPHLYHTMGNLILTTPRETLSLPYQGKPHPYHTKGNPFLTTRNPFLTIPLKVSALGYHWSLSLSLETPSLPYHGKPLTIPLEARPYCWKPPPYYTIGNPFPQYHWNPFPYHIIENPFLTVSLGKVPLWHASQNAENATEVGEILVEQEFGIMRYLIIVFDTNGKTFYI